MARKKQKPVKMTKQDKLKKYSAPAPDYESGVFRGGVHEKTKKAKRAADKKSLQKEVSQYNRGKDYD